jgi:hypothetical protein
MELAKWVPCCDIIDLDIEYKSVLHNIVSSSQSKFEQLVNKKPQDDELTAFVSTVVGSYCIYNILLDGDLLHGELYEEFPFEDVCIFSALYVMFDNLIDVGGDEKKDIAKKVSRILNDIEDGVPFDYDLYSSSPLLTFTKLAYQMKHVIGPSKRLFESEIRSHVIEKNPPLNPDIEDFQKYHDGATKKSSDSIRILFNILIKTSEESKELEELANNMGVILQILDDIGDYDEDLEDKTMTQAHICKIVYGNLDPLMSMVEEKMVLVPTPFRMMFGIQFFMLSIDDTHFSDKVELPKGIEGGKDMSKLLNSVKYSDCGCSLCASPS